MITSLALQNWKAYESLTVPLNRGTTFVVAANGTGKTSLFEAALWGAFGDAAITFPVSEAVRAGHSEASVTVNLLLPSGSELSIRREVNIEGHRTRTRVSTQLDGEGAPTEKDLGLLLGEAFGSDQSTLASLTSLGEGAAIREADRTRFFDLQQHIEHILGIDTLADRSDSLRRLAESTRRSADRTRLGDRPDPAVLAEVENEFNRREEELVRIESERSASEEQRSLLQDSVQSALDWERFSIAEESWKGELAEVLASVPRDDSDRIGQIPDAAVVAAVANEYRERVSEFETSVADLNARMRLESRALEELRDGSGLCPVCRRPLSDADRSDAENSHQRDIELLGIELKIKEADLASLRSVGTGLQGLASLVKSRPIPPLRQRPAESTETLRRQIGELDHKIRGLSESLGTVQERVNGIAARRFATEEHVEQSARLVTDYRIADLAELGQRTARGLAQRLCSEMADPISTELTSRWKQLWPDRAGVQLGEDGSLYLERKGRRIPFAHFSGGEKMLSLVLMRLLVLQMTTAARFFWLDEPLEHLDAKNRRLVAQLLISATNSGAFDQVVVTTYEESVARFFTKRQPQTADSAASVVYVRSEE